MIEYTIQANRILLSFATYDKKAIRTVRDIPGAQWDGKQWSVPVTQFERLYKLLGERIAAPPAKVVARNECLFCERTCVGEFCDDDHRMRYYAVIYPRLYQKILMERHRDERIRNAKT